MNSGSYLEPPYPCPLVNPDPVGVALWPIVLVLSSFLWRTKEWRERVGNFLCTRHKCYFLLYESRRKCRIRRRVCP